MNLQAVLQILQIGVVGLAFLLAYMAYRLLHTQSEKEKPNQKVLDATSRYMVFALALSLVAVAGQMAQSLLPANVPSDIDGQLRTLKERLDGIRLVAKDASTSPEYGCGGSQRAEPETLTVMSGLRDGTSCRVGNLNYYKELALVVPR
jgi:hypothetical protein